MLGLTSLACRSYCIPRHKLETWQQALLSVQCLLHPCSWATGIIYLPPKPHLLSFTKTIYFLLWLPTSYFKLVLKSQILLQSHQRCFLSIGHLLHSVFDCIGFYFTSLFCLLLFLWGNQPVLWRELTTETTRNTEMLRKACLASSFEHVLVHLGMDVLSRSLLKIRGQARHQNLHQIFGAQVSSILSLNLPAVCFLALETQMERRERRNKPMPKKIFT